MGRVGATIRDVAEAAGVSLATVHLAVTGKPGIRDETKRRVLEEARRLDYRCNAAASALKRGTTKIVDVVPYLGEDNYFYEPLRKGIYDYFKSVWDYWVVLAELPYNNLNMVSIPRTVVETLRGKDLAGAILLGNLEPDAEEILQEMIADGLSVVLVHNDAPKLGRLCCVQANNYVLGSIMGELLSLRMQKEGSVLICAGEGGASADEQAVAGIADYLHGTGRVRDIYKIYHQNDMDRLHGSLCEVLRQVKNLQGCCSVSARGSVELAKALCDAGLNGKMCAIGSDVFPDNLGCLKAGVFQNLISKNPYRQGWIAAEQLFKYIFHHIKPENDVIQVKSEVIFQSAVSMYER